EIAVHASYAGPDVLDYRVGHVKATAAEEPQPEAEIDVLDVAKEFLVEETRIEQIAPTVERGGGTGREDLLGRVVGRPVEAAVAFAPGQSARVVHVPDPVEPFRILRVQHAAAEEAVLRVRACGSQKTLEPV